MFDINSLLLLLLLGVAGYYIRNALQLKEAAQRLVEAHCEQAGVQLLDSMIYLRGLGLARNSRGRICLKREFQFEFTVTGGDRNQGWIRVVGGRPVSIELSPHRFH